MTTTKISFSDIVLDKAIYPRSSVAEYNVMRLLAAFQTGSKFPPLVVETKTHRLVDGWHRYETYKRAGVTKIEVIQKAYAKEADLFADAVRLNISHGEPLDTYSVRNAVLRLEQYGFKKDVISEVVRLPVDRIEKIERGFASDEKGEPIALKGGLSHMRGERLTPEQQAINRKFSGPKATFHVRQLFELIRADMAPDSEVFNDLMNQLCLLWEQKKTMRKAS
jgi:ParB-like chromosome segregation protein Spo0J